eukprot:40950-Pleurochrysis_carterae.AAC.3
MRGAVAGHEPGSFVVYHISCEETLEFFFWWRAVVQADRRAHHDALLRELGVWPTAIVCVLISLACLRR